MKPQAMAGAVLAGGQSRRYGRNKALARLGGQTLIGRVVRGLEAVVDRIFIVANDAEAYSSLGLPIYPDRIPGAGALGGLYTALYHAERDSCFCVSCDLPFLNPALIRYMAALGESFDVVIPNGNTGYQPLHSVYGQRCLEPMRENIERGKLKVIGWFGRVRVREVSAEEMAAFGEEEHLFFNVNTLADFEEARRLALRKNLDPPP